jgi:uncharacterized protein YjbJ (UPF0337 family)
MNWDRIEGSWKELKGKIKEKWGQLTDDDLEQAAGRRDQLIGTLQRRYGYERDRAERELDGAIPARRSLRGRQAVRDNQEPANHGGPPTHT